MKKLMITLVLGLAMLTAAPAQAQMRITFDPGGVISEFVDKYNAIQTAGGRIVIDGHCISACTLVTGLVDRSNVCITPRAQLGFHSASDVSFGGKKYSKDATAMMWGLFPDDVKMLVMNAGWDGRSEHEEVVFVKYEQLKALFKDCNG